jgi:aerobic carbon-monoxide dehydrogenase large subunit
MRFGIGQPVTRKEDPRFLTGRGRYVADIDLPRQAYAAVVYAPHAHAHIRSIDKSAAEQLPGVEAVLTGEDWAADGLGTLDPEGMPEDMGGPTGFRSRRPPLAQDRIRHVGERVAIVIAITEALARDAAELISVDYEVLPEVTTIEDAQQPNAPLLHDGAANNISFTMRLGDAGAIDAAFARAYHVTKLSLYNNRITAVTMEPRGCIADYDPGTRRYTLYSSTQNVHGVRQTLAHHILHVPESRIRVVARDVGGGFGMKGNVYPEKAIMVGRHVASAGRSSGSRRAPRLCSAIMTGVTRKSAPSWRLTQRAGSWACAGPARTMSAPISRAPAPSQSSFR